MIQKSIQPMQPEPREQDLLAYRSFWEDNLQKVGEIAASVEKHILALEKKHKSDAENYQELTKSLDLLLSIYASYNSLKGREYLLKLKACLLEYNKQIENESARFGVLHYLLSKAKEEQNSTFSNFPRLPHEYREKDMPEVHAQKGKSELRFRWITFRRGAHWCIAAFDEAIIISRENAVVEKDASGRQCIIANDERIIIDDFYTASSAPFEQSAFYIVLSHDGRKKCLAASEIGRKIHASRDVITRRLKEYSLVQRKYVRLFGKNHLLVAS